MRECLEPDVERPWLNALAWILLPEFDRFIALAGMGIAVTLLFMPPRVSRGRRTENIWVSCDMVVVVCMVLLLRMKMGEISK
jgi:hypothetical protein